MAKKRNKGGLNPRRVLKVSNGTVDLPLTNVAINPPDGPPEGILRISFDVRNDADGEVQFMDAMLQLADYFDRELGIHPIARAASWFQEKTAAQADASIMEHNKV